jgi:hypothetical protein
MQALLGAAPLSIRLLPSTRLRPATGGSIEHAGEDRSATLLAFDQMVTTWRWSARGRLLIRAADPKRKFAQRTHAPRAEGCGRRADPGGGPIREGGVSAQPTHWAWAARRGARGGRRCLVVEIRPRRSVPRAADGTADARNEPMHPERANADRARSPMQDPQDWHRAERRRGRWQRRCAGRWDAAGWPDPSRPVARHVEARNEAMHPETVVVHGAGVGGADGQIDGRDLMRLRGLR